MNNNLCHSFQPVQSRQLNWDPPRSGAWSQDHPALSPKPAKSDPSEATMAYKETFWMACDSTEQMRARKWSLSHPRRGRTGSQKTGLRLPVALRTHHWRQRRHSGSALHLCRAASGPGCRPGSPDSKTTHPLCHLAAKPPFTMKPGRLKVWAEPRLYADTTESDDPKVYAQRMKERKEGMGLTWLKMDLGVEMVSGIRHGHQCYRHQSMASQSAASPAARDGGHRQRHRHARAIMWLRCATPSEWKSHFPWIISGILA